MKVLYIASNPSDASTLRLEQEITELQFNAMATSGDRTEFIFLPSLPFEDLQHQVAKYRPDIVHITAHGDTEALSLAHAGERRVALTGEMLANFLGGEATPKLAFLSACNSEALAECIAEVVPMAVGTTAPITNRAARKAALAFYRRLLDGSSVSTAFETARLIVEGIDDKSVSTKLHHGPNVDPTAEYLHTPTRLIARFDKDRLAPNDRDAFTVRIGIMGAPRETTQVVFFTDDESFLSEKGDLETDLCSVVRTTPVAGEIWLPDSWTSHGDFRFFACGTGPGGTHFSATADLCEAIETFYKLLHRVPHAFLLDQKLQECIARLRSFDGSELGRSRPAPPKMLREKGTRKKASIEASE